MAANEEETGRRSPDTAGEKPVREKLQKASIDATTHNGHAQDEAPSVTATSTEKTASTQAESADATATTAPEAATSSRGRTQRKRSFDEAEGAEPKPSAHESRQGRKRSRDSTRELDEVIAGSSSGRTSGEIARVEVGADENVALAGGAQFESKSAGQSPPADEETTNGQGSSPKTKRTRFGSKDEVQDSIEDVKDDATPNGATEQTAKSSSEDSKSKEKADSSKLTGAAPQTSSSAFASSGFGAFASSSASGFGSIDDTKKLSSFASPEPETKAAPPAKPSASVFGGALGQTSAFGGGGGGSAFGGASTKAGFGSAFGGANAFGGGFGGSGPKLNTFATPGAAPLGGAKKPVRAFGAPIESDDDASEGEDDNDDGARLKSPKSDTEEKRHEAFYQQSLETGEENETTEYTCRAKLYNFVHTNPTDETSKKEWKERGLGTLRLNVQNSEPGAEDDIEAAAGAPSSKVEEAGGVRARLVMRADGSHRVILNTPIKKELRFGTVTGDAPQSGYVYFMGSIDGKPKLELLQLKMRQQFAVELYDHIAELKKEM